MNSCMLPQQRPVSIRPISAKPQASSMRRYSFMTTACAMRSLINRSRRCLTMAWQRLKPAISRKNSTSRLSPACVLTAAGILRGKKKAWCFCAETVKPPGAPSKNSLHKIEFARSRRSSARIASTCPSGKYQRRSTGLQLASCADLLRLNNAPEVITPAREQQELAFWIPAFKLAPELFLLAAQRMTFFQEQGPFEENLSAASFHPVTLPSSEAAESITPLLAQCAVPRKDIFPKLPQVSVKLRSAVLVYVPFKPSGSELIHTRMPLSINRNALKWGLSL